MHTRRSPNRTAPGKFTKLVVWPHMPQVLVLRQWQAQPMLALASAMVAACHMNCAACTRLSPEGLASGKFATFVLWHQAAELHGVPQMQAQTRLASAAAMDAACYINCAACTRLSPEELASGKFARFVLWRHRLELHAMRQLRDQQRLALAAT